MSEPDQSICEAFYTYFTVMGSLSNEEFSQAQNHLNSIKNLRPQDVFNQLELWIRKSNLLYRLIYLKEPLRTEKCPVHKGHWSGYNWSFDRAVPPCDCQKARYPDGKVGYMYDVTGWLLEGDTTITEGCGSRSIEDIRRGYVKTCTLLSGHTGPCAWTEPFWARPDIYGPEPKTEKDYQAWLDAQDVKKL